MNRQVDISLLEQYLKGEIGADEVLDIEGNKMSQEEFKEAIAEFKDLTLNLEAAGLKQELQNIHLSREKSKNKIKILITYSVAASLLLILALTFFKRDSEPLKFEDFFTPFDQLLTFRGSIEPRLDSALQAYSEEEYVRAYSLFQRLNIREVNLDIQFYTAVSALGAKEFDEALELFKSVSARDDKYQQQVRWYLALSYWQLGEFEEAIRLLNQIESGQFKYQESQNLRSLMTNDE